MTMDPVLHSLNYSLNFLAEQVEDVDAADMAAQPAGITNHPSWTIGHLIHVLQLIGTVIGIQRTLPPEWIVRYGPGSKPVADITVYETKEDLIALLLESRIRLAEAVSELDDSPLDQPFPDPAYLDVFPTVRHALNQVLVGHTAFHIGQLSVWRKAMGLPAIERSYE
jgi:hypothetical protein